MEASAVCSGDRKRSLLNLPSGYHFRPTEEELIVHYLRPKIDSGPTEEPPPLPIFRDLDVFKRGPEEITEEYKDFGEDGRWYFFTMRTRKYKRGNRSNRTTEMKECWKASGRPRLIYSGKKEEQRLVGRVKTLVFYDAPPPDQHTGLKKKKAQSDLKTNWTMYEYENLTSQEEAADPKVDKLGEWVLCTIQEKKKKEGDDKEGGSGGEKKAKETKGKTKAASKKRKVKQTKMMSQQVQDVQVMKIPEAPMLPAPTYIETLAHEGGYETAMFDYASCPRKSSPMPTVQHYESPPSETVSPCIIDSGHYCSPNMAPTPCLPEQPRSEMMSSSAGGNYNTASAGSNELPCYDGLLDSITLPYVARNTKSCSPPLLPMPEQQEPPHPHMGMDYETPPFQGYNNHNFAPNMATYQPDTNYFSPLSVGTPTGTYSYSGAAQNLAAHQNSYGNYADPGNVPMLMNSGPRSSQHHGLFPASSSQYHGGPSVLGQGIVVAPAPAPLRQDELTAST